MYDLCMIFIYDIDIDIHIIILSLISFFFESRMSQVDK